MESKFPVDMHIYMICSSQLQSFMKLLRAVSEELRWQNFSEESFILAKFLSSKRVLLREKKWIKISFGYVHLHILSFINVKFQEILLSSFRGVALTIKKRTNGLTDWLKDRSKTLNPSQLVAWGIINVMFTI